MNWRFGEYGWRLLPGGGVALLLAILLKLGGFQPFEQVAYNALFRLRGTTNWDDRLVLISIDDASVERLGRFPWTRQRYVQLLNVLAQAKPEVVAIDLLWSESSPDDDLLAQAIARSGQVILAQAWDGTGLPLLPVPSLQEAALATGHILTSRDADGLTRKVDLYIRETPSLGLAAVQTYGLVQSAVSLPDTTQPLWLNWAGSIKQLPRYSFADVIDRKIPLSGLQNKIVIVGVTATGIDPSLTPFDRNPPASGVHLQATVIHNLLQKNALKPIADEWIWLLLLIGGPGFSWLLSYWRNELQIVIGIGVAMGWSGLSFLLLTQSYWIPVALPLGLLVVTTMAVTLSEWLRINILLHQQVQQLWQVYQLDLAPSLPTPLLSQLSAQHHPASLQRATQLAALANQLGRSQSTQAAIARSLSIGLLAADLEGVVWFCNPVAAMWLKVQVGDQLEPCLVPNWFTNLDWQQDLATLHNREPIKPREFPAGDRWIEIKLEPLHYPQPTAAAIDDLPPDGLLLLLTDITTQKQIAVTLDQQIQELQRLSQLKDDFLSTVSHELRTPLTNIKMAVQLLKVVPSEEKRRHYLTILDNECLRETNLINDLLDLQRLEAGAQTLNLQPICLQDWLPPIIEPFYKRTEARQQTLIVQLPDEIPCLWSDEPGLERIVVELVNNACKYTPSQGEIIVTLHWTVAYLEINVRNSGIEIAKHELPHIFDRFYRTPQSNASKQSGTGLGLALVKKLVEHLGGRIDANSSAGQTVFTVQLPLESQTLSVEHLPVTEQPVVDFL